MSYTRTPVATVKPLAASTTPAGWLLCDGAAVSRTTYAALFNWIGTTYGVGDGSTTFNVPDLRGRIPAGRDNMGGTPANRLTPGVSGITATTLGASGGVQAHSLVQGELAGHSHSLAANGTGISITGGNHQHVSNVKDDASGNDGLYGSVTVANPGPASISLGAMVGDNPATVFLTSDTPHTHTVVDPSHDHAVGTTGTGTAHQNTQPSIILNYVIKT